MGEALVLPFGSALWFHTASGGWDDVTAPLLGRRGAAAAPWVRGRWFSVPTDAGPGRVAGRPTDPGSGVGG